MKWRGKMANDIDVVITWVDDNDVKWRNERAKYLIGDNSVKEDTKEDMRFRNWDNLQYVFRGIEKYMPWVRKIHFVTYGHLPKWLNTDNPKLNIVRHEDFMPKEYLPSFNGCAIALNMHRIPGLSEQFIYFNDDMFVIKPTKPEDFFKNGIPCDMACLSPQPVFRNMVVNIETNNLEIINDHFTINDVKYNKRKWINFRKYGMHALRTFIFSSFSSIIGIYVNHLAYSYNKSTFEEVWEKEYKAMDATSRNKFRTPLDNSEWLMREWQIMSGRFEPREKNFGLLISAGDTDTVKNVLRKSAYKMVCINDGTTVTDFEATKKIVNEELDRLLPEKSGFEKE